MRPRAVVQGPRSLGGPCTRPGSTLGAPPSSTLGAPASYVHPSVTAWPLNDDTVHPRTWHYWRFWCTGHGTVGRATPFKR